MKEILEVAWHESGHAVMAHMLGMQVISVRVADGSDGTCVVSGTPGTQADPARVYPLLIKQKVAGCVAQFLYRYGSCTIDREALITTVNSILSGEAPVDLQYVEDLSRVIARNPREARALVEGGIVAAHVDLSSASALVALGELAQKIAEVSPRELPGATVHQVLSELLSG